MVISYRVYSPGANAVGVQPFVLNGSWSPKFGSTAALAADWNAVTYTIPAASFQGIGLQINNGSGFAANIYNWGAAPPAVAVSDADCNGHSSYSGF